MYYTVIHGSWRVNVNTSPDLPVVTRAHAMLRSGSVVSKSGRPVDTGIDLRSDPVGSVDLGEVFTRQLLQYVTGIVYNHVQSRLPIKKTSH